MDDTSEDVDITINKLTIHIIEENMTLLGVVAAVTKRNLIVNLPGRLTGIAPVTEHDEFSVGSVICCKVTQICRDKENLSPKSRIILSINPSEIYENLSSDDVKHGMIFQSLVESKEDFGYVINIGLPSVRAFLKDKLCSKYIQRVNKGEPLKIGQIIPSMVMKVVGTCVTLICNPKPVTTTMLSEKDITRHRAMIPGIRVVATVSHIRKSGLVVSIGNHIGAVNLFHLENCWKKPSDYSVGETVVGTVLYIEPVSKIIYLDLKRCFGYLMTVDKELIDIKGQIVDGTVMMMDECNITLKIQDKYRGVCKKDFFPPEKELIRVGSETKCRVLSIDYMDNCLLLSMKDQHVADDCSNLGEIEVGDVIEATIHKIQPNGVIMTVTSLITGFVPNTHISDFPTFSLEKQHKLQTPIQCKVISVDPEKRGLVLSMKKSIVKSKHPVLKSLDGVKSGLISDGTISYVNENFVKIRFCGDVEGVIHKKRLLSHNVTNPISQLRVGQTVTCKVLYCVPEKNKLHVDFMNYQNGDRQVSKVKIGQIYEKCRVKNVLANNIEVELEPEGIIAFISNAHVSDYIDICKIMKSNMKEGDILPNVVGISNESVNNVSMKHSFITEAMNNKLDRDYEVGDVIPSEIVYINPNYVNVQLANGITGKVKRSSMTEIKFDSEDLIGLSLMAKILSTDKTKLSTSTLVSDCCNPTSTNDAINLIQNYLRERQCVVNKLSESQDEKIVKLSTIEEGKLVNFRVTRIMSQGMLGLIEDDIPAVVTYQQMDDCDYEVGKQYAAIVINVDLIENCAEVDLKRHIINSVRENAKSRITPKQTTTGIILFTHQEYILVLVCGKIAFLPSRKHLNDCVGTSAFYTLGNSYPVVVDNVIENRIFLTTADKKLNTELPKLQLIKCASESLVIGRSYKAKIIAIEKDRLQIKFRDNVLGQIFITDITDSIQNGTNPLESFTIGQNTRARVVSFTSFTELTKENSITDCNEGKSIANCSLREEETPFDRKKYAKGVKVGSKVISFVEQFGNKYITMRVNRYLTGRVYILDVSHKYKVITNAANLFTPGNGYSATVIGIDGNSIHLSLIRDSQVKPNRRVACELCSTTQGNGVLVTLPGGYTGTAGLTDISDDFSDVDAFVKNSECGNIVRCYIFGVDENKKTAKVSLRLSKFLRDNESSELEIRDPEVNHVVVGQCLRGIVKKVDKNGRVVVQLGRKVSGLLSEEKHEDVEIFGAISVRVEATSPVIRLVRVNDFDDGAMPNGEKKKRKHCPDVLGKKRKFVASLVPKIKKRKMTEQKSSDNSD